MVDSRSFENIMADEESARPMDRKCPPCELRHRSALYLEKDGFTERLICIKCHLRASINREIDSGGIPKMIQIRQVFTNHIKQISDWVQSLVDRNIRITEEERIASKWLPFVTTRMTTKSTCTSLITIIC